VAWHREAAAMQTPFAGEQQRAHEASKGILGGITRTR
jgi:hypothetical protein